MPTRPQLHRRMKHSARSANPPARSSTKHAGEELAQADLDVHRNPRTGRPIRESAGRRKSDSAYVNTADAVDDDGDSFFDPSEDEEGNPKKRKRSPPPARQALDLVPSDFTRYGSTMRQDSPARSPTPDPTFESYRPLSGHARDKQSEPETISLTLNIPPGFSGPVHFTIDKTILHMAKKQRKESSTPVQQKSQTKPNTKARPSHDEPKENLILKLPPELRNKVYNYLFKSFNPLELHDPHNFSLSSAFLRTCRKIHDEGCDTLYGANHFGIARNPEMRAPLWVKEKKEVGYHDFRLWLHTIGPNNITRLRTITLSLNDALPSARGIQERHFVRDDHLIYSLRMLAHYGQLHEIDIIFSGRKPILRTDFRFLDALRRVKCDDVRFTVAHMWASRCSDAIDVLKRNMVRRTEEGED